MQHAVPRRNRRLTKIAVRTGVALTLAAAGQFVLIPAASAASNLNVSTTADIAANAGACGNTGITTPPSPLSLREATCLANNIGGAVNINVPAGTYNLANGELAPGIAAGSNVSIIGAGAGSTVVNAGGNSRVFDLDRNLVGGVSNSISGLTITGGADSTYGGAGIIAGSNNNTTADVLNLNNVVITGNAANGADMTVTNKPGGGVQFLGGQLTISNSTISNNTSGSSYGSGVAYGANGDASPEGLTITNTTFSGNSTANSHNDTGTADGGALALFGTAGSNFNVSNSRFVNNTSTSTSVAGPAVGGAIWQQSGHLTVTESNFTGNSVSGGTQSDVGGAIEVTSGTANLNYNRIVGNMAPAGSAIHSGGTTDATENWFGCNAGPGSAGCDTTSGSLTTAPRLVLKALASPATVVGPNGTSTISASLVSDSANGAVAGSNLDAFDALPATFSDPPGDATVTPSAGSHTAAFGTGAGHADIDYHSGSVTGPDPVNVTFDNQTVTVSPTVDQPPAITSPNTAHFNVGQAGSFTVTTSGYPNPALTESGTLPAGLTFTDNGDGTATLSGTATGPGGSFPLTLTANNGVSPNATQTLTVTVGQPPAFTSGNSATFTAGSAGTFTVTTSGIPTVSSITESGTLPSGVTFTDNGNGTATVAGTPAAGSGGTYPVTLTATNGVSPNATQTLTITVNQAPAITTNPSSQTVNPGTSVTFTAAASGVPTPTVQWQRSTDGGASYTNIAGATATSYTFTAAAGDDGNLYRAVFTNAAGTATTTTATLHVGSAPAFSSSNAATFAVGTAGNFAITTSGVPNAAVTETGAQFPAWLTLTDHGDGTAVLTGTPPAGSGGQYTFTLRAANGFNPDATQTFTLSVDDSPTITSTNHATFTVGSAGSFSVTTTAGFPTTTGITETGALPSGVTLVDNGDGTATLSGTPAAGAAGTYPITIRATATGGVSAPATQSFTLTVNGPPVISSANHATFAVGAAGSFTVTTTAGFPAATTLTKTGTLPSGLAFTDNGDGTATIAGTPAFGTGGVYPISLKASNGIAPDATQTFTLTVNQPPVITSTNHATFTVGAAAAFTVTTAPGQPTTTTLTETGALPAGITFTDNGDGTATLGGTATAGGTFALTVKASNGVAPDPTQAFTLTVNQPPAITSTNHATFTVGNAGSFTVTTTAGTPAARTLTETGALPTGVTFLDNGNGTATLAGTPAAGQGGSYPLTIRASNGVAPVPTQAFTLTVLEPTAITSANHATFQLGTAGSFTVTTAGGFPTPPVLSETGALPAGVSFTDNGDGTATLAGTPTAGGTFGVTITASNGVNPDDVQAFTLTVNESPAITSADHTTFSVGTAGSFTVTTTAGTPAATTLTESGTLPSGVTFVDNGDGTATLAGTAAADQGGSYALTITASNGVLPDTTQAFTLTTLEKPALTSHAFATFTVGAAGSFTVGTSAGYPTATTLSASGLPAWLTFTDNGDGTGTLTGIPPAGSGGTVAIELTAANTTGSVNQAFTLTVNESPVITSAAATTFAVGTAGSFTVTTTPGNPTATTITGPAPAALPNGVTFTAHADGTATLAGTPAVGSGGSYAFDIVAGNASGSVTQHFTLTVTEPPAFTSANSATFVVGAADSFTVTTTPGFPVGTTLAATGLPAWLTFTDNGGGTGTLTGTAPAGSGGDVSLSLTATNTAGTTTQPFTLHVLESAAITSANHATFTAGTAGTFTVTTAGGVPTAALTETGTLPDGVTFVDNHDGTATLAGTPSVGGVYLLTIKASNGVTADSTQDFTLTVDSPPAITSPDKASFVQGVAGSFAVTIRSGVPAGGTFAINGTLPKGLHLGFPGDSAVRRNARTFAAPADATFTISGTALETGTFPLTIEVSNGVAPDAVQHLAVVVNPAPVVSLPATPPVPSAPLHGVPTKTLPDQKLTISGTGCAAGAAVTIGYYPPATVLGHATAGRNGHFVAVVNLPKTAGKYTIVAACTAPDGTSRFVAFQTQVLAAEATKPSGSGTGIGSGNGGSLANTGPDTDPLTALGYAGILLMVGLSLLVIGRRRRA